MKNNEGISLDKGIQYEVVREMLADEIGYQNRRANDCGRETPRGMSHLKALDKLILLKETLRVSNPQQIDSVDLALQAMVASRGVNVNETDVA